MGENLNIPETADKGLEGVIAFTSRVSAIMDTTLTYRGYTIEDLAANSRFEEVAYLLWHGKLPNQEEYKNWCHSLSSSMELPSPLVKIIRSFPKTTMPMEALRSSVSLLSMWDPDRGDNSPEALVRQAIRITAKIPSLIAAWHRIRNDWDLVQPDPSKTIASNFFTLLNGKATDKNFESIFDTALILHADHEMNASTFSARVTTATQSDVYSSMTSAIGTLMGPLHGGANEQVMRMLDRIGSTDNVENWLQTALEKKEKIMGFGHRVYKNGDPRAAILKSMSKEVCQEVDKSHLYEMSVKINDILENQKGLMPNVDFYSASLYHCLGIPTDLFTPVFALARSSGWLAHIMEQRKNNRLIRPRTFYIGESDKKWVPINERS